MVRSSAQAVEIQKRRVAAGKRGIAKAVRRFVNRTNTRRILASIPMVAIARPKAAA